MSVFCSNSSTLLELTGTTRKRPMTCKMVVCKLTILTLIVLASGLSNAKATAGGVRMCGRRLADLLNIICERHGGFHAPKVRRTMPKETASKGSFMEILRPMSRKDAVEDRTASFTNGVVDECCKKQCSLTTLASYCASPVSQVTLEEILTSSSSSQGNSNNNNEIAVNPNQDQRPQQNPELENNEIRQGNMGYASRPNLGMFSRDRPVFIVLSQLQDDEDHLFGEYRF